MVNNQNRFKVAEPQNISNKDVLEYLGHWGHKAESFLQNTNTLTPDAGQEVFNYEMQQLNIKEVRGNYTGNDYQGFAGAYQQTGFDPFDKMIPNGFAVISNSDWYIPDNFVSYIQDDRKTRLCWVEVKGTCWIKNSDIEHYRHFQKTVDDWNYRIAKAGKWHIKAKAPIEFKIAIYPSALATYLGHQQNNPFDEWKPNQQHLNQSYWLTFAELEDRFYNNFREEQQLPEKVSFYEEQMRQIGFPDFSDKKYRRKI